MSSKIYHFAIIISCMAVIFQVSNKLVNMPNYFKISMELLLSEIALLLNYGMKIISNLFFFAL